VSRARQGLLAAVALVAALAAFWVLALSPKRQEIAALDAQVAAKQGELSTGEETLRDYAAAKAGYQAGYAKVVRLGKAVPADDDTRSLLVQLADAARRSGVDFHAISVGQGGGAASVSTPAPGSAGVTGVNLPPGAQATGTQGLSAMPFSFTFTGSFFALSDFFGRLERFVTVQNRRVDVTGRLLVVSSIDLQVDAAGFPRIRAQVGATSYLSSATDLLAGTVGAGATLAGPSVATAAPQAPTGPTTATTTTGALR
jgi:Tfp pilus assembly protein PilO